MEVRSDNRDQSCTWLLWKLGNLFFLSRIEIIFGTELIFGMEVP